MKDSKNKGLSIGVAIVIWLLLSIVFGAGGWYLGTKFANKEQINDGGNVAKDPIKNDKFTFLSELVKEIDGIKVSTYYYSDKEKYTWYNEEIDKDEIKEFYVLRSETFVNGFLIGDVRLLEVSEVPFESISEDYSLYHEVKSVKDTKNDNKYVLVTLSENSSLIQDGIYSIPYSETPVFNNLEMQDTYLVDSKGKVLKNFSYSDCWLSGIMVNKDEIEDRSSIYTDFSVYDEEKDGYVDKYGDVIYSYGSLFDVKGNYFYWLDRIDGNKEYKYSIEDGKLIEKYIKSYDYDKYDFMEVGCI